jgi:hypothetical protein
MKKITNFIQNNLALLIWLGVVGICLIFTLSGIKTGEGYITMSGEPPKIEEYTERFIEEANEAIYRIMNEDAPTDEETIKANEEEVGLGGSVTLKQVLARRLPDGDNDNGLGWQCSKYTAYLATGKREYSKIHTDYGPVNGKDVASWLVKNYGWKYTEAPVEGAIGSGGFNTKYGHTAMYLYSTGANSAMVNDANFTPLKVSTHNMNISGWVWVVPGDYVADIVPEVKPVIVEPTVVNNTEETYTVRKGDTLGAIARRLGWYTGNKMFGNDGYTQHLAEYNGIKNRGLIYPGQVIRRR